MQKIGSWYKRYEHHFSSVALVGGFIFDILTLRRADAVWENSWTVIHLATVAAVILLLGRREKREDQEDSKLRFWLLALMQFSFGGLLSAFLVLYFRSATLSVSWPFLLILALAFAANERLKGYQDRLLFQISFFYLSLLSFAIFFVPVLVGDIGPLIFILSGLTSLIIMRMFLKLLERVSAGRIASHKSHLRYAVAAIFLCMNILYFLNIIPPIPMSLREGGIYHSLQKDSLGNYILTKEKEGFLDYFDMNQEVHAMPGNPLFAYTAVFSPARFTANIIHEWQFYDEERGEWLTMSRISLATSGGRGSGYRTYSLSSVKEGRWRVNVLTKDGLTLGRVSFNVVPSYTEPPLVTEVH